MMDKCNVGRLREMTRRIDNITENRLCARALRVWSCSGVRILEARQYVCERQETNHIRRAFHAWRMFMFWEIWMPDVWRRPPSREIHALLALRGDSLQLRLMLKAWRKRTKEKARFSKIVCRFSQRHGTRDGRSVIRIWRSHTKAMHALQRRSWLIGQKVERRDLSAVFHCLWSLVLRRRQYSAMTLRCSHLHYTRILCSALNLWYDATKEEREERTRQEARSARQQIGDARHFLEGAAREMTSLRGSLRRLELALRLNRLGGAFAAILCSVRWSRWQEGTGRRLSKEKSRALVAKCFSRMMLWDTQQIGLHSSARLARDRKTRQLKSNVFMALAATFDLAWATRQTVDSHQIKICTYLQKKRQARVLASFVRHFYQITRVKNARTFRLECNLARVRRRLISSSLLSWIRTVEWLRAQSMQSEIDRMTTELEGAKDMLSNTSDDFFSLKSTLHQIDHRQGSLDIKLSRAYNRIVAGQRQRMLDQTFHWWAYATRYHFLLLYSCSLLARFQHRRCLAITFNALKTHIHAMMSLKRRSWQIGRQAEKRALTKAYSVLLNRVQQRRQDLQFSQRCDIIFDMKVKTHAWFDWLAAVRSKHAEQMKLAVNDANERLEQAKRRHMLRVLLRWQNRILIIFHELWRTHVSEQKYLKMRLLKAVLRLTNAIIARVCSAWQHQTQEGISQRMLMGQILRRLANGVVFAAFARWLGIIDERKEFRARRAKQQTVTRRILKRMLNRSVSAAFERWCEHVQEERQLKSKAKKIVLRLMNGNIAFAFDQWQQWATQAKTMKRTAAKVVKRLINRSLSVAFDTWLVRVESESNKRDLMTRVVTRMVNMTTTLAFDRWAINARESVRVGNVISKTLTRMRNLCAVRAFTRWKTSGEEQRRMFLVAGRVVKRWTRNTLAGMLYRWVKAAEDGQQK